MTEGGLCDVTVGGGRGQRGWEGAIDGGRIVRRRGVRRRIGVRELIARRATRFGGRGLLVVTDVIAN